MVQKGFKNFQRQGLEFFTQQIFNLTETKMEIGIFPIAPNGRKAIPQPDFPGCLKGLWLITARGDEFFSEFQRRSGKEGNGKPHSLPILIQKSLQNLTAVGHRRQVPLTIAADKEARPGVAIPSESIDDEVINPQIQKIPGPGPGAAKVKKPVRPDIADPSDDPVS